MSQFAAPAFPCMGSIILYSRNNFASQSTFVSISLLCCMYLCDLLLYKVYYRYRQPFLHHFPGKILYSSRSVIINSDNTPARKDLIFYLFRKKSAFLRRGILQTSYHNPEKSRELPWIMMCLDKDMYIFQFVCCSNAYRCGNEGRSSDNVQFVCDQGYQVTTKTSLFLDKKRAAQLSDDW